MKKLPVYKRLNKEAEIMGFPFMIFFGLLFFTLVSAMIVMSSPLVIGILWGVIYIAVIIVAVYIFKKHGLKTTQKRVELYFRNPTVIKYNQNMTIKKLNLDINL